MNTVNEKLILRLEQALTALTQLELLSNKGLQQLLNSDSIEQMIYTCEETLILALTERNNNKTMQH